jgi:chromate transporter
VVALITSAGLSIIIMAFWGEKGITSNPADINPVAVALFLVGLIVLRKFKLNPILVMLGSGIAGMIIYLSIGG